MQRLASQLLSLKRLPDLTHLLGCRELSRLEAELSRDLRPGVVLPDLFGVEDEEVCALLELGVEVDRGPALVPGVAAVPGDTSSLAAPLDFRLDFLLDTRFLLSMSDSRMLCCDPAPASWLLPAPAPAPAGSSRLDRWRRLSGNMLAKDEPAMVQDLPWPACGEGEECDQDMLRLLSRLLSLCRLML